MKITFYGIFYLASEKSPKWILAVTLFFPIFPFDSPENIRRPMVFWYFKGGGKREYCEEKG